MNYKYRKCAHCGATAKENPSLMFHRFPRPDKQNSVSRAKIWAEFCYPGEDWTPPLKLYMLFNSHRMLCSRHFDDSSYMLNMDKTRRHLNKFSVPTLHVQATSSSSDFTFVDTSSSAEDVVTTINDFTADTPAIQMEEIRVTQVVSEPTKLKSQDPVAAEAIPFTTEFEVTCVNDSTDSEPATPERIPEIQKESQMFRRRCAPGRKSSYDSSDDSEGIVREMICQKHEVIVDKFVEEDKIKSFSDFISNLDSRLCGWFCRTEKEVCYLYIIHCSIDRGVSVVNSLVIKSDFSVKVFLGSMELSDNDLKWVLPNGVLTLWSQFKNILSRYKTCTYYKLS